MDTEPCMLDAVPQEAHGWGCWESDALFLMALLFQVVETETEVWDVKWAGEDDRVGESYAIFHAN